MWNSAVLDVAIGMIFVFLIVSFGVTSGTELVSSLFRWRATNLAIGVRRLLDDQAGNKLSKQIYQHALIRGLHHDDNGNDDKRKPSHLPPRLFATALLDIALTPADVTTTRALGDIDAVRAAIKRNEGILGARPTQALLALADHVETDTRDVGGHMAKLQASVEQWFNGAMERCGGWYKRRTQLCSVIIALALCVPLNVDSLRIARTLANSPVLRASLIAQAEKASAAGLPGPRAAAGNDADANGQTAADYRKVQADLAKVSDLGIPMGWESEPKIWSPGENGGLAWWLYKLGGIVLTAVAASLGAPFWFDLLQKLLGLRTAISGGRSADPAPTRSAGDEATG